MERIVQKLKNYNNLHMRNKCDPTVITSKRVC